MKFNPYNASISLITLSLSGRGENGVLPNIPEYNEKRTTIVLMPVGRLPELVDAMLEQGYPSTTPSALIEKGTWGVENGEKYVRAPLSNILDVAIQNSIASPAVFVVGDVVDALAHLKRASGGAKELEGVASIKRIPGPYDDISVQPRRKKSVC